MSNSHMFLKSKFINSASKNGVGRYICQLQRVVFKFCKNNGSSSGMRDFIESDLIQFAKDYPGVVVYLKPRRHRAPVISAEYLNGDKQLVSCRNLTSEEINKWVNLLRTQAGTCEGTRLRKMWHTEHPSIQGAWTPFTFADPANNLMEFPNEELSKMITKEESATQKLIDIFNKHNIKELDNNRAE